ncbi:hypothetical protein B0H13DRAFT_2262975 [Mycena leptocephala]|nr:hypothetical protein B0H13DRAFT_2262975 [Mycena leptocephala]
MNKRVNEAFSDSPPPCTSVLPSLPLPQSLFYVGGHLILWNLKLVIRFPPGSTVLIPSAIIRHSNVPVGAHKRRYSFTQYTVGGLFRWIRNGYRTDEGFEQSATPAEKAARKADDSRRWEAGVAMYSTVPA